MHERRGAGALPTSGGNSLREPPPALCIQCVTCVVDKLYTHAASLPKKG